MELFFLALLIFIMAFALGSGYPVAFALPGAAIISIVAAAICGWLFTGSFDSYFHSSGPSQWLSAGVTNLRGVYWDVDRDTLIAIPLFIFMGLMLQRSRIAEDLLVTMAQLFGPVPGGLGISVVFVGALLAATTGIVGATVVAMGLISLPAMLQNNYAKPLATGTIAASGTLGQIIPPSIVLIILADQLASASDQANSARKALHKSATDELSMPSIFDVASTSAGEMFLGAFLPGLVLVGLYMAYILVYAILRPKAAPTVPRQGEFNKQFWQRVALILLPPLTLILMVLGSIIMGIATVNQAGAIGAAGALIMAGYRLMNNKKYAFAPAILALIAIAIATYALANYPMNIKTINTENDRMGIVIGLSATFLLILSLIWSGWRAYKIDNTLHEVMIETAKTTSLVFIILLGAAMLTAAFRAFGGEELVKNFLNSLPGGFWMKFIIVMAVIFILGFFLDFIEIAVVVVPIVAPILLADPSANITAVWLGVMIGLNIQTSFLTPPFGFALFYLRGVAPAIVKTLHMYKGVVAFIILQIVALVIVAANPPLVNYLPNRISLLSENAPPPRNPRLRFCVNEYITAEISNKTVQNELMKNIELVKQLDLTQMPEDWQKKISNSTEDATLAIRLLAQANNSAKIVANSSKDYRPLHTFARKIESDINNIDKQLKKIKTRIERFENDDAQKQQWQEQQQKLLRQKETLQNRIPQDWVEIQALFRAILNEETRLRTQFYKRSKNAYETITDLQNILQQNEKFEAVEKDIASILYKLLITQNKPDAVVLIKALNKKLTKFTTAKAIKQSLKTMQKELQGDTFNSETILELFNTISNEYAKEKTWRQHALTNLLPTLAQYEKSMRPNLGLLSRKNFERQQALQVAKCLSHHRDISLNF